MALPTTNGDAKREGLRSEVQVQATALMEVLDEDIRHVEATLSRLDALRGLLIKRDDQGLERLLEEIRREGETYVVTERRRQELRQHLARLLGWKDRELTISSLLKWVTGDLAAALAQRQMSLRTLVDRLKREHTLTALLLSDCRRFNRSLLHVFLGPAGKMGTTYSPSGAAQQPTGTALLNAQF